MGLMTGVVWPGRSGVLGVAGRPGGRFFGLIYSISTGFGSFGVGGVGGVCGVCGADGELFIVVEL